MIIFMSIASIAVVALLVMVFFEHKSMKEYDAKKVELLEKINKIFKQQYTPVKVNVGRIENDAKEFTQESRKVESKFGHPYEFALKRFAEVVAIPLNEFRAKFGEFWEAQRGKTTRDLIFRRYKVRQFGEDFPNHRSTWNEAMNAFTQEAQKVTLEKIEASNVDEIFLAAMGKGRMFSDSPSRFQTFMKRMRNSMIDYFGIRKVDCADTNFSFDETKEPAGADVEAIANSWEIVADLGKRIADAKVDSKESVLQLVEFSKRELTGEKDGDYLSYRFNFTVNADIATIRRIFEKLYGAYTENRIYAVRNIKLNRIVDKVEDILVESERLKDEIEYDINRNQPEGARPDLTQPEPNNPLGRRLPGPADARRTDLKPAARAALRPPVPGSKETSSETGPRASAKAAGKEKEKKKALTPKDPDYARTIVGSNNIIKAEFEVDYIVYDNMSDE